MNNFLETFANRIKEEEAGKNFSERQKLVDEIEMGAQNSNFSDVKQSPLASADEKWRAKMLKLCNDETPHTINTTISFSFVLRSLVQERLGSAFIQLKERLKRALEQDGKLNTTCVICQLHQNV